jgi:hypothetical protein
MEESRVLNMLNLRSLTGTNGWCCISMCESVVFRFVRLPAIQIIQNALTWFGIMSWPDEVSKVLIQCPHAFSNFTPRAALRCFTSMRLTLTSTMLYSYIYN